LYSVITERMRGLLGLLAGVGILVVCFSVWTWASSSAAFSDWMQQNAVAAVAIIFVAAHLLLIILGLTLQPTEWVRTPSAFLLCVDGLLIGGLLLALLSSNGPGWEAAFGRGLAMVLLLPSVLLAVGLLVVCCRVSKRLK
jgi:hypothetical protein